MASATGRAPKSAARTFASVTVASLEMSPYSANFRMKSRTSGASDSLAVRICRLVSGGIAGFSQDAAGDASAVGPGAWRAAALERRAFGAKDGVPKARCRNRVAFAQFGGTAERNNNHPPPAPFFVTRLFTSQKRLGVIRCTRSRFNQIRNRNGSLGAKP